jgi:hypothetical protein
MGDDDLDEDDMFPDEEPERETPHAAAMSPGRRPSRKRCERAAAEIARNCKLT